MISNVNKQKQRFSSLSGGPNANEVHSRSANLYINYHLPVLLLFRAQVNEGLRRAELVEARRFRPGRIKTARS